MAGGAAATVPRGAGTTDHAATVCAVCQLAIAEAWCISRAGLASLASSYSRLHTCSALPRACRLTCHSSALQANGFQDQEQVDGLAAHMRSFVEVCGCRAENPKQRQHRQQHCDAGWPPLWEAKQRCKLQLLPSDSGALGRQVAALLLCDQPHTTSQPALSTSYTRLLLQIFWAACHTRPQLFNLFLVRSLPPPGVDWSGEWARIAQESLPLLRDSDVSMRSPPAAGQ